ncbi:MAG: hypothetical protein PUA83_02755 [Clostridiales bacterium]|nr:hypothetical protein [Clostridiales bacterium]
MNMKPRAIVYKSNTGHTERYAGLLGDRTGLPVFSLDFAEKSLGKGEPVIFLGWLSAGNVKGYKKAAEKFRVCAVCGVGLCDTGTLLDNVRKTTKIPPECPVFTVQGGLDREKLRGGKRAVINLLTRAMRSKKDKTLEERRMTELLIKGGDFVCAENLSAVLEWYESEK